MSDVTPTPPDWRNIDSANEPQHPNSKHTEDLFHLWTSQNELIWSRVQTIYTITAAILVAWYELYSAGGSKLTLAIAVAFLGVASTVAFLVFNFHDYHLLDQVGKDLGNRFPTIEHGRRLGRYTTRVMLGVIAVLEFWLAILALKCP